jgi:hypothetical protein
MVRSHIFVVCKPFAARKEVFSCDSLVFTFCKMELLLQAR